MAHIQRPTRSDARLGHFTQPLLQSRPDPRKRERASLAARPSRKLCDSGQLPVALATSTETPGPMVDEIETFFM